MKEAYCSYEIAKLLKEKGFAEPLVNYYYTTKGERVSYLIPEEQYLCPTHQMACAWLREKGYHISILYQRKYKTWGRIIQELSTGIEWSIGGFDSYDRAVEASLKYALENLIEEQ